MLHSGGSKSRQQCSSEQSCATRHKVSDQFCYHCQNVNRMNVAFAQKNNPLYELYWCGNTDSWLHKYVRFGAAWHNWAPLRSSLMVIPLVRNSMRFRCIMRSAVTVSRFSCARLKFAAQYFLNHRGNVAYRRVDYKAQTCAGALAMAGVVMVSA